MTLNAFTSGIPRVNKMATKQGHILYDEMFPKMWRSSLELIGVKMDPLIHSKEVYPLASKDRHLRHID